VKGHGGYADVSPFFLARGARLSSDMQSLLQDSGKGPSLTPSYTSCWSSLSLGSDWLRKEHVAV
jgi:hypothetical protein